MSTGFRSTYEQTPLNLYRQTMAMLLFFTRRSCYGGRPYAEDGDPFVLAAHHVAAGECAVEGTRRIARLMAALVDGFCESYRHAVLDHASTSTIPATRCTATSSSSAVQHPLRRALLLPIHIY